MATTELTCVCGHPLTDHTVEKCLEPTGRCECDSYDELCPNCKHAYTTHDGQQGQCTRIVRKTMQPCACKNYPPEE